MSMSNLINTLPIDSNRIAELIVVDEIDPAVDVFASWSRVIAGAPIENKPALFGMMAGDAAVYAERVRADTVDGLWMFAQEIGLVKLVGAANVQAAIAVAFDRGAT
jgi:hypothetical protein